MADQTAVPPFASPAQPAPAKAARRRWPRILLAIFVLILLIIALLPTIASTGPVRRMASGLVNRQLDGTVSIDSWSFGWFSGFKLTGIRFVDAQGHSIAEAQSVTLPAGVPALFGSRKQLGTIVIESPKANIVLYADTLTRLIKLTQTTTPAQPLGFDVSGDLVVTNGEISVQPDGAAKPLLVRDLNMDVKIESLEKPIHLDVKAALGEERAALSAKGSATVLHAGNLDLNAVEAELAVTLGGLEIGPVAELARQYGLPVEAGGTDMVRVPGQRVSLSLHNGRIYQGPMQITLPDCTITTSGSVGLADNTLDMAVEIPITLAMVGGLKNVYQALKGEVIRVAITGTTDQPEYSVKDSLQKLIQNAARKLLE